MEFSLTFLAGGQRPADGQTSWAKVPATVRAHLSFHNIAPLLCNNYPFAQALQGWLNFSILKTKTSLTLHESYKQLASYFLWQQYISQLGRRHYSFSEGIYENNTE